MRIRFFAKQLLLHYEIDGNVAYQIATGFQSSWQGPQDMCETQLHRATSVSDDVL